MASAALDTPLPPSSSPSTSPSPAHDPPSWISPRISFSFDLPEDSAPPSPLPPPSTPYFEFPSLPAPPRQDDLLISRGQLLPLHLSPQLPPPPPHPSPPDPSPKAPRCSARLRDLLRLRRRRLISTPSDSSSSPLLQPLPSRHSLDSDRLPSPKPPSRPNPDTVRPSRPSSRGSAPPRGVSVDSPRMNPSGRVVFHGLERSSSSPGSFNGGTRAKSRPIQRSYSANVRIAPVINVFGFAPMLSASSRVRRRPSKTELP